MAQAAQQFFPIREISAYHSRWVICAKVTMKSEIRTFRKGNGDGKVFHVELHDKEGGEIRASFFNLAADNFYKKLEVGKAFTFSKGTAKVANRQYNQCNHRYELTFDRDAQVEEVTDGEEIEVTVNFNFSTLRSLGERALPPQVGDRPPILRADICGVITSVQPAVELQSKQGTPLLKREITVADDSGTTMLVTIWGERAKMETDKFEGNPIAGFKGLIIKEWNGGRSGSLSDGGALVFEPKMPEVERLRLWWKQGGSSQDFTTISTSIGGLSKAVSLKDAKVLSLSEMRMAAERVGDTPETFIAVSRLLQVQTQRQGEKTKLWYQACAEPRAGSSLTCNKRLDEGGFCQSCNKHSKASVRMFLRSRFGDRSDSVWLTSFDQAAQGLLAKTGEQVKELDQTEQLEAALRERYFGAPLQLTIRAKLDSYNGEVKTNITVQDARPVNYGDHGRKMLSEVKEMLAAAAA